MKDLFEILFTDYLKDSEDLQIANIQFDKEGTITESKYFRYIRIQRDLLDIQGTVTLE